MKNKSPRARMQVIVGTLLFILATLAEMYVMINEPMQYIAIAALGVLSLGCAYIAVNGYLVMQKERSSKSDEQNEYIYKSGKASFLVSKKNFEEIGDKLNRMEKSTQITTKEIVNAQKGIAKVIMSHSRKDTDALRNSNNLIAEQLKAIADRLDELAQAVTDNRNAIEANRSAVNAVIESQEKISEQNEKELIVSMKDMELRINNAIMQMQKASASSPAAAELIQETLAASAAVESSAEQQPAAEEAAMETDASAEVLSGVDAVFAEAEDTLAGLVDELPELTLNPKELPEPESDLTLGEEYAPEPEVDEEPDPIEEPEMMAEVLPESGSDMSLMEEVTPEPEVAEEPIEKEIPKMPDLSDPNKALSLDEIDALFANMGVEVPEPKVSTEPEPIFMPDVIMDSDLFDEPEEELEPNVIEELSNMPEPEAKTGDASADLADSNKPLSLSEIDELLASMGVGDKPTVESPTELELIPEPELSISEDKPEMPDLSDPNKALSADDIAALFANLA